MTEFFQQFFHVFIHYVDELWLTLVIGFFLSGFFYYFIPSDFVTRHLGDNGIKPILIASFVGALLPVCCIGSLPIALTLQRKGASLGGVLAFLVATPATSITALFVCWKLLGMTVTVYIFFAAVLLGIVMGLICSGINFTYKGKKEQKGDCCRQEEALNNETFGRKFKQSLHYGFVVLPKDIGLEIIIGVSVASFITVFEPIQQFIHDYLVGMVGYAVILVTGLLTYVCSTASVPMADALIESGMSQGQAITYLIAGPITSYATILVIKKDFGVNVLVVYLSVISVLALVYGMMFDLFLT